MVKRRQSRFKADMDTGMALMMQDMHSPGYTGQPDSDFLAMLILHHEGAVDIPFLWGLAALWRLAAREQIGRAHV